MSRELVTPIVGERIWVRLPMYSGPYELGKPGETAEVRVVKRYFDFAAAAHGADGMSGFHATLVRRQGQAPRGRRLAFMDRDIAYVPANFVKEG